MKDIKVIKKEIDSAPGLKELEATYKKYLGRKGELTLLLREIGTLAEKERKKRAPRLQKLKKGIEEAISKKAEQLKSEELEESLSRERIDVTVPGRRVEIGRLHPLTQIQNKAGEIFTSLGFSIAEGPEVESEWYNFDALNIPDKHPARDLWDTFWLKCDASIRMHANDANNLLLRTHTSPVQIRYMEKNNPPFRIIAPGRAFRHEASDSSHDIQFYQLEGLMVDRDISVANLRAVISEFLSRLFEEDIKLRLRPSFFPFVEPGFEVDMACTSCAKAKIKNKPSSPESQVEEKEKINCSVCKDTGWLEMMGAGMVHPNVFKAAGLNVGTPRRSRATWQGFAFGIGIDRIAMMKYKVDDIRLFYSGDLRFLKQF